MAGKNKIHHFRSALPVDSLGFSLLGAAHAVARVENGTSLPAALSQVFSHPSITPQATGAIQDIAYRTVRHLGLSRALLGLMAQKQPEPPVLRALLYCALSLLSETDGDIRLPYEPYTVVNQGVKAAASLLPRGKGFVNAILRRFLREGTVLLSLARQDAEAAWNYPKWWCHLMQSAWPENWKDILKAGNAAPPMTLRLNRKKSSLETYLDRLRQADMNGIPISSSAIVLDKPAPVTRIPGFSDGMVSVQDAAAQLAAPLLDLDDGMRVLDACAAPGGKTGHILETANVHLLALDSNALRLERIRENLQRLKLQAEIKQGDAARQDWWDGRFFDRILADVPCTASGVVRRHPDIKWLRRETDIRQLTTLSAQILGNLWQMLRPGGKLLFATCSVWPEESERQAEVFASRHHVRRLPAPGQLLPTTNRERNHDGLFYALFQKPSP